VSKRKNRGSEIPKETLERARQQAEQEAPKAEVPTPAPAVTRAARAASVSSRAPLNRASTVRKRVRGEEKLSPEQVAKMLANPTKEVTEEDLRQQYGYVLADLRSMGILAASLMVALIVLAQILPR
jgi:hypothetical protein